MAQAASETATPFWEIIPCLVPSLAVQLFKDILGCSLKPKVGERGAVGWKE